MKAKSFIWHTQDGTRMFACEWKVQAGEPKAILGIVHGMGENTMRYQHVAKMFNEAGYAVLAFDQRGHGRTSGRRGHITRYEDLMEGVDLLLSEATQRYPNQPVFLYGHSMGGNVVLNYLLRRKPRLQGAVVTSPWLKLGFSPSWIKVILGKILHLIWPTFSSKRALSSEDLTTDRKMQKTYENDPLSHDEITARFFIEVEKAGVWALQHAKDLHIPVLLMQGSEDHVTSVEASDQFATAAGSYIKWRKWPHLKHELHYELKREEIFSFIHQWLADTLKDEGHLI